MRFNSITYPASSLWLALALAGPAGGAAASSPDSVSADIVSLDPVSLDPASRDPASLDLAQNTSQNEGRDEPAFTGRPLVEALLELQGQGLELLFTSKVVRPEMIVPREPQGATPRLRLEDLLHLFGLTTRDSPGGTLVVVSRPGAGPGSGIHGEVREVRSKRPLEGVQVLLTGTRYEAATGPEGRFTLPGVPPGTYRLVARRPGFVVEQRDAFEVPPWGVTDVSLELLRTPLSLDEVVVTPSLITLLKSDPVPALALQRDEIIALPHLGDDLFRALTLFPGTSANELTAQLSIRGGRADEVLIMLDQLELIEPYHLQDFLNAFSIIAPKAIAEVDLILGGFPAQFGDRMGGVLDMKSTRPSAHHRSHVAASVLGAQAGSAGSFADGKGQVLGVGRYGFPRVFLNYLGDQERPQYWDLFGKVELQAAPSHLFGVRLLEANDSFELFTQEDPDTEMADTDYRSSYAWATHQGLVGPRLLADTVLSQGRVQRDRHSVETMEEDDGFVLDDTRVLDVTGLKQDWSFQPSENQYWRWGFDVRRLEIEYDYFSFRQLDDPLAPLRFEPRSGTRDFERTFRDDQYSGYLSDRLRLGRRLTAELGARYDQHTITGDKDLSPRFNLVFALGESSTLRTAWGYFFQSQRPYELSVEDGETQFQPSERTELFAIGYEKVLRRGATLRLEAYHRDIRDPRRRYENVFEPISSFPEIEPDRVRIVPERSTSRGIEVFLRSRRGGRVSWWVNYAYSRVEDEIGGRDVPRSIDQPHALNFDLEFRLSPMWTANLAFRYHTGWPTTAVTGRLVPVPAGDPMEEGEEAGDEDEAGEGDEGDIDDGGEGPQPAFEPVPVFGPLNAERLPDYHRLDLRLSRQWKLGKGRVSLFFDFQNLYNRKNIAGQDVELEFGVGEDGSVSLIPVEERWGGFLPSVGIEWEF